MWHFGNFLQVGRALLLAQQSLVWGIRNKNSHWTHKNLNVGEDLSFLLTHSSIASWKEASNDECSSPSATFSILDSGADLRTGLKSECQAYKAAGPEARRIKEVVVVVPFAIFRIFASLDLDKYSAETSNCLKSGQNHLFSAPSAALQWWVEFFQQELQHTGVAYANSKALIWIKWEESMSVATSISPSWRPFTLYFGSNVLIFISNCTNLKTFE